VKIILSMLAAAIALCGLAACGGGSSSPAGNSTPPAAAKVQGVQTPKTVSVVTAN